jgi:hypothetical protein
MGVLDLQLTRPCSQQEVVARRRYVPFLHAHLLPKLAASLKVGRSLRPGGTQAVQHEGRHVISNAYLYNLRMAKCITVLV